MSRAWEWAFVLIAFTLVSLASAGTQPVTTENGGLGRSGAVYHAMAKAMPKQMPPVGTAPEIYRVGVPFAVAAVAKSLDWVMSAGFDRLNVVFGALSIVGFTWLMQRHIPSVAARLVVVVAFLLEPHSPIRLSYYLPISVNAATIAFLIGGIIGIDWFRNSPTFMRAAALSGLVGIGVAIHEVVIVIGLCALFRGARTDHPPPLHRDRQWDWLPLISGIVMLAALHTWIVPTPTDFTYGGELRRWLTGKSVARYFLSWGSVFGPLLGVALFFRRQAVSFLAAERALLVYLVSLSAYAWVGGPETEELLSFASPVIWLVIGRAIVLSGITLTSLPALAILAAQAISSRVFVTIGVPLDTPVVNGETWERLGWAGIRGFLSYANMRSQSGSPGVMNAYYALYAAAVLGVLAFLYQRGKASGPAAELPGRIKAVPQRKKPLGRAVIFLVGFPAALGPIVWLATSRFYWNHFEVAGPAYLFYNLGRIWTGVVLFAVFWATGSRVMKVAPPIAVSPHSAWTTHIECAFVGAALWSVGVVILATLGLYHLWLILFCVAIGVGWALSDLSRLPDGSAGTVIAAATPLAVMTRLAVIVSAAVLLLAVAIWGDAAGDNDVFGTYLAYYQAVIDARSNWPNPYYVHYWITKGHGLGFLFNILSDVQGAALATVGMIVLGAAMVWRLSVRSGIAAPIIGWAGACAFLGFYMHGGAVGKPHTVRAVLILYLAMSFAVHLASRGYEARLHRAARLRLHRAARLIVITAVLLLTPMSIAIVLPMCLAEALLVAYIRGNNAEAFRMMVYPLWTVTLAGAIWSFNYLTVGLPEAPVIMRGHFMNADRFSRWLDPALAYMHFGGTAAIADRNVGAQAREVMAGVITFTTSTSNIPARLGRTLSDAASPASAVLLAGGVLVFLAVRLGRRRLMPTTETPPPIWTAVGYLAFVIAILVALRVVGGDTAGSPSARFTDFIEPLVIASAILLLSSAWFESQVTSMRGTVNLLTACICAASIMLSLQTAWRLPWLNGLRFLVGAESYASMHEPVWGTATAARVAAAIPGNSPVGLLTYLPAFTGLPSTRFQMPDGCGYCKEFSVVVTGSPEQAEAVYRKAGIEYFLVDLADDSAVLWPGFGQMFAADSLRSRLTVFAHMRTDANDFFVLTWKSRDTPSSPDFEEFMERWTAKVTRQRTTGYYRTSVEASSR